MANIMTGKPTPLMSDLLRITRPGDVVFDPFMGSGTTGVACLQNNRGFIGCEVNSEYFKIAEKRMAEAESQINLEMGTPANNRLQRSEKGGGENGLLFPSGSVAAAFSGV